MLNNRKIIDVLIGDEQVCESFRMPYYSGPDLCELSTMFGLPATYYKTGGNLSRWMYMRDLLAYVEKQGRTAELLAYLFDFARFESLQLTGTTEQIREIYSKIVQGALDKINTILLYSESKLQIVNKQFFLTKAGEAVVFEAPKVKTVTYEYICELPERIKDDITKKDYDSVVTKSRTLLEEVMIYIMEKMTKERYKSNGDLMRMYAEMKSLINMTQNKDWDIRVNDLLSGINKIVDAIGKMRNMNSDAYGTGSGRIDIKEREARLIAASAVMVAEYLLSVYQRDRQ